MEMFKWIKKCKNEWMVWMNVCKRNRNCTILCEWKWKGGGGGLKKSQQVIENIIKTYICNKF